MFSSKLIGVPSLVVFLVLTVLGAMVLGPPQPSQKIKVTQSAKSTETNIDKWSQAGLTATAGDATVKIVAAEIGPVQYQSSSDFKYKSKDEFLKIKILIHNDSDVKKQSYVSWGLYDFRDDLLTDIHGNSYRIHTTHTVDIEGQLKYEDIYPQQTVGDLLVFARPVKNSGQLRLFLPGIKITGNEPLFFKIPVPLMNQVVSTEEL